jgi:hypothetical protein
LGTELRDASRHILERIIEANNQHDRAPLLQALRQDVEKLKVLARLCHESGGFTSTRAYLHIAEQVVNIAKQNEGWLRQTTQGRHTGRHRSEETGHGQNRTS